MSNNEQQFVVRNNPGLEGAFRIHLSPDCLIKAGLNIGDICQIADDHGKFLGNGIAWRALDKIGTAPKMKPAKMSETLRDAYGIKEGSQVSISATKATIERAETITLVECGSAESDASNDTEDHRWRARLNLAICLVEATTIGATFDVIAKKGVKKRFLVTNITTAAQSSTSGLFYADDNTKVELSKAAEATSELLENTPNGYHHQALSTDGIGGLVEQLKALNLSMRCVLEQNRNENVLIHGYEGTGKSMLLKTIESGAWRKVHHLQKSELDAGSVAKNKALIIATFQNARAQQPSLILLDDLHTITEESHITAICQALDDLHDCRILVVAACRSPTDLNSVLLKNDRFETTVELPIPDLKARILILDALLKDASATIRDEVRNLGSRTHGYTGEDLARLVRAARRVAIERQMAEEDAAHDRDGFNGSHEPTPDTTSDNAASESRLSSPELTTADLEAALAKVRPSALGEFFCETPKTQWSDIGGSDAIKARFEKALRYASHSDIPTEYRMSPQKGVLLYGPPGCSKTLTAQAVAANYEMNFISIQGAELVSMYVGESERAVREVFRRARTAKPCIIFFDEIDSIAAERDAGGTKGLNVLTTLLTEMDGFGSHSGVLVLAATNKPEILDPAIMRPGRFDQHIYLPPPDAAARREILNIQMSGRPTEDEMDFQRLARDTEGYTGAEIVRVCELATDEALDRRMAGLRGVIGVADFEKALEVVPRRVTEVELAAYRAFATRGM